MRTNSILFLIVNNIGVEGAKRLAEALEHNSTLTSLNLDGECHVYVRFEEVLLQGLILFCCLIGNSIGVEGAKQVAEALERNNTLTSLHLNCGYHAF